MYTLWHYTSLTKFREHIWDGVNECNMWTDLQMVIYFHTHLHGFLERGSSHRKNHKLLHIHMHQKPIVHYPSLSQTNTDRKRSSLWKCTCIASLFPACDPPLMTLKEGTGKTNFVLPARFAICCTKKMPIMKSDSYKNKENAHPKIKNTKETLGCVCVLGVVEDLLDTKCKN